MTESFSYYNYLLQKDRHKVILFSRIILNGKLPKFFTAMRNVQKYHLMSDTIITTS